MMCHCYSCCFDEPASIASTRWWPTRLLLCAAPAALLLCLVAAAATPGRRGAIGAVSDQVQLQETSGCPAACGTEGVACTSGAVKPVITTSTTSSTTSSTPEEKEVFWESGGELADVETWRMNVVQLNALHGGLWRIHFNAQVFTPLGGFNVGSSPFPRSFPELESGNYHFVTWANVNLPCALNPGSEEAGTRLEISSTNFFADTLAVFDEGESDPAWKVTITHWHPLIGERRLQNSSLANAELSPRRMQEVFRCPDGCEIPALYVNDDFCDCSNCADEVDWTCGTCNDQEEEEVATGVGVGVGVSAGLALGIGLGVGLGTGVGATGTASAGVAGVVGLLALAAQGLLRLRVSSGTLQDPDVVNALKETIARLSGSGVKAAAVELIINCVNAAAPASNLPALPAVTLPHDGDGQSPRNKPKVRRLTGVLPRLPRLLQALAGVEVGVCFQVQVADTSAEEVCQTLNGYDSATVQAVLSSELESAGVHPQEVTVIGYDASPNPRSYHALDTDDANFFAPASGVSLGRL
ncbi:unnamed protein product [Durusdinium trenchii]|uniref:Uncharacterized protein n=1 Tax=Durusdinium trenchii TaxID=1381693 RepID=A0ABP0N802_9DINO